MSGPFGNGTPDDFAPVYQAPTSQVEMLGELIRRIHVLITSINVARVGIPDEEIIWDTATESAIEIMAEYGLVDQRGPETPDIVGMPASEGVQALIEAAIMLSGREPTK